MSPVDMRAQPPIRNDPFSEIRKEKSPQIKRFTGFEKVGDTGSEYAPETPCFGAFAELGEAECEALSSDAALRELVRLWSTLSKETKDIISAIIKSRSS